MTTTLQHPGTIADPGGISTDAEVHKGSPPVTTDIDIIGMYSAADFVILWDDDEWYTGIEFTDKSVAEARRLLELGSNDLINRVAAHTGADLEIALAFTATMSELLREIPKIGDMLYFHPSDLDPMFHEMLDRIFPDDVASEPGSLARAIEEDAADRHGSDDLVLFIHTKATPEAVDADEDTCAGHTMLVTRT